MKKVMKTAVSLFALSLVLPLLIVSALPDAKTPETSPGHGVQAIETQNRQTAKRKDLRGLWVATVVNIDYPSKPTADSETLKSEATSILDHAKNLGLNAVFLQVRPTSDALYKSKYFPWSKYLTGNQGVAPGNNFDPLAFWIEEAHKRDMELHAWINPYRITKKTSKEKSHDFASLAAMNPAKLNPSWVVKYSDGNLYYDPGIPAVRKLVIDGVLEIIKNYDVDGIHFDDYFYPGKDFYDKETFKKYGKGYNNIDDWRRENVNILIRDLSKAIKAVSPDMRFGISPFGIWANNGTNPLGSDTKGMQSYYDHYADTRKWVKEGWIDYIAPQIYWNIGYDVADYGKLLSWWENVVRNTGVDLYIGQAAYRQGNSDPSSPWYGVAEIERQLKLNAESPEVKGSIFFSSRSLIDNPSLSAVIKGIYEKKDGVAVSVPLVFSRPIGNIRTSFSQFYLNGSSDPQKPLYLNGKPVEKRSKNGYFGILVPLSPGANTFTFSQEGSYATRVIYRETYSAAPSKMSRAEIPAGSVFPQAPEYRAPGEKIKFYCKAPLGSTVTVKIGGISYNMKPSAPAPKDAGIFAGTYTYIYTVPSYGGTPKNIDLGAPVYTMNYKGIAKTVRAPAEVGVIMKGSPYFAEVEKDVINTYAAPESSDGAAYELYRGMFDYVTGMTGNYVRLSSGQWVKKSDVKLYMAKSRPRPEIRSAVYTTGEKWDSLKLGMTAPAAAIADFDGASLKLNIAIAESKVLPKLPGTSLFSSVAASKADNGTEYILTPKDNQRIEGYYIEKKPEGLVLYIKRPVKARDGEQPLSGITIMLDPGHGGSSTGAIGPLGPGYAEKTINLNTSLKLQKELERLGAKVLMTRTEDNDVSLEERLTASRNVKPDMFISIHANSMEDNVDMLEVTGFSVFYREAFARQLSELIHSDVIGALNRSSKGIHKNNFYVTRGTWTPSVLLESGFVPNPNEFEWLTDENEQAMLARTISQAIVRYFE